MSKSFYMSNDRPFPYNIVRDAYKCRQDLKNQFRDAESLDAEHRKSAIRAIYTQPDEDSKILLLYYKDHIDSTRIGPEIGYSDVSARVAIRKALYNYSIGDSFCALHFGDSEYRKKKKLLYSCTPTDFLAMLQLNHLPADFPLMILGLSSKVQSSLLDSGASSLSQFAKLPEKKLKTLSGIGIKTCFDLLDICYNYRSFFLRRPTHTNDELMEISKYPVDMLPCSKDFIRNLHSIKCYTLLDFLKIDQEKASKVFTARTGQPCFVDIYKKLGIIDAIAFRNDNDFEIEMLG